MSVEFCKTYAQLIGLSADAPADSFYSTENYNQLGSLGPSLPQLDYAFPKGLACVVNDSAIAIQLKSIRPPYKFSTKLDAVHTAQSVYKVKGLLISAVDALQLAGIAPSDLKFMIKSKVLTDSTPISSLVQEGTDLSITVMVSAPSAPPAASKSPGPAEGTDADPACPVPLALSAETWGRIHSVLVADVGVENAQGFLEKFKAVA